MNEKLKPCPMCNHDDVFISIRSDPYTRYNPKKYYCVQCAKCGCRSLECDNEAQAVFDWNKIKRSEDKKRQDTISNFAKNYIKSCPFCGYEARVAKTEDCFYVVCNHCGSRTIECVSFIDAINIWNIRQGG